MNRHPNAAGAGDASSSSQQPDDDGVLPFRVGVAEDRNKRWRRTMEDAHAFVYDFGGVHGQGYFSIFDGHAGKHAAEWCGKYFHEYLLETLASEGSSTPIPDVLNRTFHRADAKLGELASQQGTSSGCTAVTCFLRLEDESGKAVVHEKTGGIDDAFAKRLSGLGGAALAPSRSEREGMAAQEQEESGAKSSDTGVSSSGSASGASSLLGSFAKRIRKASSSGGSGDGEQDKSTSSEQSESRSDAATTDKAEESRAPQLSSSNDGLTRVSDATKHRRVLYTANVGDARAVLCRKGHAVRLTYDHKASDHQEAKRITDAGGFVMNNRVNAVLAVTRSLGDSAMKEFVVGAPYTTETVLSDDDSFLIVACDGLWDVVDDEDAVRLVQDIVDPQRAAQTLLQHALSNFSTDNTSVLVVRFNVAGEQLAGSASASASTGQGASVNDGPNAAEQDPSADVVVDAGGWSGSDSSATSATTTPVAAQGTGGLSTSTSGSSGVRAPGGGGGGAGSGSGGGNSSDSGMEKAASSATSVSTNQTSGGGGAGHLEPSTLTEEPSEQTPSSTSTAEEQVTGMASGA